MELAVKQKKAAGCASAMQLAVQLAVQLDVRSHVFDEMKYECDYCFEMVSGLVLISKATCKNDTVRREEKARVEVESA
jgi:hypothetical protein